jgi:hypothetical protein
MSNFIPVIINAFQTRRKHLQDAQIAATNGRSSDPSNGQLRSFLDYAKKINQGKFLDRIVDDIKSFRRIIVVFLLLIPYWLIYMQVKNENLNNFRKSIIIQLD